MIRTQTEVKQSWGQTELCEQSKESIQEGGGKTSRESVVELELSTLMLYILQLQGKRGAQ